MLLGKKQGQSPQGTDESSQELGKKKEKKTSISGSEAGNMTSPNYQRSLILGRDKITEKLHPQDPGARAGQDIKTELSSSHLPHQDIKN